MITLFLSLLAVTAPIQTLPYYDIGLSMDGLYLSYQLDTSKADKEYKNKRLLIRGKFGRIYSAGQHPVVILLNSFETDQKYALSVIKAEDVTLINGLKARQSITLICTCRGKINLFTYTDIWLDNCNLVSN